MQGTPVQTQAKSTNPFAALSEENRSSDFLKKFQEDLKEGWSFQGKKKYAVKISSPR
jgi:hypothetical protein